MREALLEYIVCPSCKGTLVPEGVSWSGRSMVAGSLTCTGCRAPYPIIDGVPDFVQGGDGDVRQTTEGFADNWKQYNRVILANELLNRDLFADWIWPLRPSFMEDKVVVDAGCGMGRWLRLAAEHRPKALIGFDFSTVAFTAFKNTEYLQNVHLVRADIFHPPFAPVVDVVYSIGVLHHTPEPGRAFRSLLGILHEGGVLSSWVYGAENNGWITTFVDPIRKYVTSRLPHGALNLVSSTAAIELRIAAEIYALLGGPKWLPYREYILHLREYPLGYMTHIVYDHLVPSLARYIRREELLEWAEGLSYVLSPRNANSWRLLAGRRRAAVCAAMAPLTPSGLPLDVEWSAGEKER